jgi:hypothetical protein
MAFIQTKMDLVQVQVGIAKIRLLLTIQEVSRRTRPTMRDLKQLI